MAMVDVVTCCLQVDLRLKSVSPKAVTHPSSNRAQCRLTTLIEANELTIITMHYYIPPPLALQYPLV